MWIVSILIPVSYAAQYFQTPSCGNWQDHKDYCEANGAILATFDTPAQVESIWNACTDSLVCYIGFHDDNLDGQLEFVDGVTMDHNASYALWYNDDEPELGAFVPGEEDHVCGCIVNFNNSYTNSIGDCYCNGPCWNGVCEISEDNELQVAPEPLPCQEAQKYCKETYGTQLATIATDDDRADAISALSDAGHNEGWIGLYSDPIETQWRFRAGDDCPSDSVYNCVDFWLSNPGGEEFRPRCIGSEEEGGYECGVFYADRNGVDNDVPSDIAMPFLCDTD